MNNSKNPNVDLSSKAESYSDYLQWKGWKPFSVPLKHTRYFQAELKRANIRNKTAVLEIGFGNGDFLRWASKDFASVVGFEILPELVNSAKTRGFEAYLWDVSTSSLETIPTKDQLFDLIVAFDVFEHLASDELQHCLSVLERLLTPDGKILARFPNGDSPLSLSFQNSDKTHKNYLTHQKIEHATVGTSLNVKFYGNAARTHEKRLLAPVAWAAFAFRDLLEMAIGYAYFGRRISLDPNAVAILSKAA
jgi:2-polyprenyl-3-methyl-5-hydroxy-6-metoxy-1,4-benzoquinol methylase